ncbi:peptidase S45 penicillin amidase [Actinosynnema mirum DSM 43827]|uniref:Peptidase S45 penicillin amidase n=2 Tax=Actinosynnema mirum TaxID=40567 RepID=C6WC02_ACTMD|nr:penicillin acylase family protein [Actinosynnema mirum]ACU37569.1 peptidase S45 penicillin amidase [Actinosynnema mirum DSM 43827]
MSGSVLAKSTSPSKGSLGRRARFALPVVVFLLVSFSLVSPLASAQSAGSSDFIARAQSAIAGIGYRAEIRRTSHGIPHVLAADLGSAGFGQGWAYAEDRLCDLADQVVKVRGERSRWLGAGAQDEHLASDLGYLTLGLVEKARRALPSISRDARALLEGYAAGYNRYLAEVGPGGVRGWCAGQPWIGPVTAVDLLAYQQDLAIVSSGRVVLPSVAVARPPGDGQEALRVPAAAVSDALRSAPSAVGGASALGSNGWALGGLLSSSGRGALLANPHFPWQGELQLWESHLTVPGTLDVYGAGIGGLPGVQIGFTEQVAWTHTVAPGPRFTFAQLQLTPGRPTGYRVGDRVLDMRSQVVVVQVKQADGRVEPVRRTMWSGEHGPIVDLSSIDAGYGWTTTGAIEFRDANADNSGLLDFWLGMARTRNVAEVAARHVEHGTPWLNTLASDRSGTSWYGNAARTPNLTPEAMRAWSSSPIGLLDGGDPKQDWRVEPGAVAAGLLPASRWPRLTRADYVFNANNSPWAANPRSPLRGYPQQLGQERLALPARARLNALLLEEPGPTGRFTLDALVSAVLADESLGARSLLEPVRGLCRAHAGSAEAGWRDAGKACAVLDGWDGRFRVDSRGAVLWRELLTAVLAEHPDALNAAGPLLSSPFDPRDPVRTPGAPRPDPGVVGRAIDSAQRNVEAAGFPLDVPLGAVQHSVKGGRELPVPGAPDALGAVNVVERVPAPATTLEPVARGSGELTSDGYRVNTGTSFLLAVQFTDRGPRAKGLLTFSQSIDPRSPHFADQQALFARGEVRECLFTWAQIQADPQLRTTVVRGT